MQLRFSLSSPDWFSVALFLYNNHRTIKVEHCSCSVNKPSRKFQQFFSVMYCRHCSMFFEWDHPPPQLSNIPYVSSVVSWVRGGTVVGSWPSRSEGSEGCKDPGGGGGRFSDHSYYLFTINLSQLLRIKVDIIP